MIVISEYNALNEEMRVISTQCMHWLTKIDFLLMRKMWSRQSNNLRYLNDSLGGHGIPQHITMATQSHRVKMTHKK